MAYDSDRGRVMMNGGQQLGPVPNGELWEWDGTVWTEVQSATPLGKRAGVAFEYDSARQRLVLFGGATDGTKLRQDTWEY